MRKQLLLDQYLERSGGFRERSSQMAFLKSKRESEDVKCDLKMPNSLLIYDRSARAENTTLERQEQSTEFARAQEVPLELQDTRIKYIRSSVKISPLKRKFSPPRTYTKMVLPARAPTSSLERDPLEHRKSAQA